MHSKTSKKTDSQTAEIPASTIAELRSITDPLFPECREAYAKYDRRFQNTSFWKHRMLGFQNDALIAVGAYAGGRWLGGFVTYPLPMRGPAGEAVRGGKMEAMIVSEAARGKRFRFADGREEKVSVAISRALIHRTVAAGIQVFFGIPNPPAYSAHRLAEHGLLDLPQLHYLMLLNHRRLSAIPVKHRLLLMAVHVLMAPLRRWQRRPAASYSSTKEVAQFSADVETMDDLVNERLGGIGIHRRADYLNWRYPSKRYVKIESRRSDGLLTGMMIGARRKTSEGYGQIIDILTQPSDNSGFASLIGAYIRYARAQDMSAIRFSCLGKGAQLQLQQRQFREHGFVPMPAKIARWIVDGGNGYRTEDLLRSDRWNVSGLAYDFY